MPLEMESKSKKDRAERARELIARVGLEGFENHYPRELSGGMRRRASLARMLISDPETLLLDEPFGALDAQLREDLQQQLLKLWQGSGRTVIFVTHDIEEAVLLADRVVVLGARGSTVLDKRVDIPRPRDLENVRSMPIFSEYRSALTSALKPVDKVDIFSDTRGAAT